MKKFQEIRNNCLCYPFLGVEITRPVVDDIFEDLRKKYEKCEGSLDVIVDSGGGDIDAAYNISMLFRKYGYKKLNFIIPRWAKSAATLLVCSGDIIYMSPVAELGPLDPQITQIIPAENRVEQISPLNINSTLDIIRQEFESGNEKLANALMKRLQFPLTLGGFIKYHEIGEQYLIKLLESRMLSESKNPNTAKTIARRLTKGYANHGFCINIDEAKSIGLNVVELTGDELDIVWKIHRLNKEKRELERRKKSKEVMKVIKTLPPELMENMPKILKDKLKNIKRIPNKEEKQ